MRDLKGAGVYLAGVALILGIIVAVAVVSQGVADDGSTPSPLFGMVVGIALITVVSTLAALGWRAFSKKREGERQR